MHDAATVQSRIPFQWGWEHHGPSPLRLIQSWKYSLHHLTCNIRVEGWVDHTRPSHVLAPPQGDFLHHFSLHLKGTPADCSVDNSLIISASEVCKVHPDNINCVVCS